MKMIEENYDEIKPIEYPSIEQRNNFKLTKNTKGKNWEFKIIEDDLEKLKLKVLEMNKWSEENFK